MIVLRSTVVWDEVDREEFAKEWPGCDIPERGTVVFSTEGQVVEVVSFPACNADLSGSGGFREFLTDLYEKAIQDGHSYRN